MSHKRDLKSHRTVDSREIYSGKIVRLVVDQIDLGGRREIREVVHHPGGVVILGRLADGRIPLVRQHRYPMDRILLELPAGKLDPGETPRTAAIREMEEETGFRPESIEHILSFYATPGYCDELLHLFFSEELVQTRPRFDPGENLEIELYTLTQALELASRGGIQDGKTLVALYWLQNRELEAV